MLRNLLYNCCAFEWHDEWRRNVDKLNQYKHVFTGRRIVLVRQGQNILPAEDVLAAFEFDAEFIMLPNDPIRWENSGFLDALGKLEDSSADGITFYAHTKGVRYSRETGWLYRLDPRHLKPIRVWRDLMYDHCLSDPEGIDRILETYSCCGCFQRPLNAKHWAFYGTFYWLRNSAVFSQDWRSCFPEIRDGGTEAYPSALFSKADSYCLHELENPTQNLYRTQHAFTCVSCKQDTICMIGLGHAPQVRCQHCGGTAIWQ